MKHRRGTELDPDKLGAKNLGSAEELAWLTFDKLSEWYLLGARCSKCERAAWLDRWDLERRFSKGAYINQLAAALQGLRKPRRKQVSARENGPVKSVKRPISRRNVGQGIPPKHLKTKQAWIICNQ